MRHATHPHAHNTHTTHTQNYDIDVPLFLPIYAHGRLSDLRAIAATKTLGQMNFNSGWEWCVPNQTIQVPVFLAPKRQPSQSNFDSEGGRAGAIG